MLALYAPAAWLLLLPVIGIEALVGTRWFHAPPRLALSAQAVANGVTTLAGIPLAWAIVAGLEFGFVAPHWSVRDGSCALQATVQALWILPPVRRCSWVFPVALVLSWTFFFGLSVVFERAIVGRFFRGMPSLSLWQWAVFGNLTSYMVLVAAALALTTTAFEWAAEPLWHVTEAFGTIAFAIGFVLGLR
jgi:hypothetical protein